MNDCSKADDTMQKIGTVCDGIKAILLEKNRRYGNSALAPLRVFSRSVPSEGIRVRLDDKLSRIRNAETLRKNDIADTIGYLVLLCVAEGWTDFGDLID